MHKGQRKDAGEDLRKVEFPISKEGAVMRAFASHQCVSGSIPARSHIRVEFVSRSSGFPPVTKTNISKFQFQLKVMWFPF